MCIVILKHVFYICMNLSIVLCRAIQIQINFHWCCAAAAVVAVLCLLPIKNDMWYDSDIVCEIAAIFNFNRMLWNKMCVFLFLFFPLLPWQGGLCFFFTKSKHSDAKPRNKWRETVRTFSSILNSKILNYSKK